VKFGICVAGIIISFFIFGLITEQINECHDKTEKVCRNGKYQFSFVQSAILSLCYWSFAKGKHFNLCSFMDSAYAFVFVLLGALMVKPEMQKDETHVFYYVVCGLLNVFSIVASTAALEWVSYPTQVISKSAKPVPVIILCRLIGIKTYSVQKYVFVLVICVGVGLAIIKSDKLGALDEGKQQIWGVILLLFSLFMDGILAVIEVSKLFYKSKA
jgi:solute carrier family 35 (UDP-galactose transporter), member B1